MGAPKASESPSSTLSFWEGAPSFPHRPGFGAVIYASSLSLPISPTPWLGHYLGQELEHPSAHFPVSSLRALLLSLPGQFLGGHQPGHTLPTWLLPGSCLAGGLSWPLWLGFCWQPPCLPLAQWHLKLSLPHHCLFCPGTRGDTIAEVWSPGGPGRQWWGPCLVAAVSCCPSESVWATLRYKGGGWILVGSHSIGEFPDFVAGSLVWGQARRWPQMPNYCRNQPSGQFPVFGFRGFVGDCENEAVPTTLGVHENTLFLCNLLSFEWTVQIALCVSNNNKPPCNYSLPMWGKLVFPKIKCEIASLIKQCVEGGGAKGERETFGNIV